MTLPSLSLYISTMHYFRKKSSSSSTPANKSPLMPTVEHIKQEPTALHFRNKDQRALVASSSAIALSIASPFCDPTDTVLDEPESSKVSGWKTAYGAAKIAVEIANESSDMFLPLKAVLGALSVLIKSCDVSICKGLVSSVTYLFLQQTAANSDQIADIEKRVQSLSEILASPVDDQDSEERLRREALRRFELSPLEETAAHLDEFVVHRKLAGIVAKLKPLSEKHGIVKFLRNADYANILNGFVQDLVYAVTDYQVWGTDSITRFV